MDQGYSFSALGGEFRGITGRNGAGARLK